MVGSTSIHTGGAAEREDALSELRPCSREEPVRCMGFGPSLTALPNAVADIRPRKGGELLRERFAALFLAQKVSAENDPAQKSLRNPTY